MAGRRRRRPGLYPTDLLRGPIRRSRSFESAARLQARPSPAPQQGTHLACAFAKPAASSTGLPTEFGDASSDTIFMEITHDSFNKRLMCSTRFHISVSLGAFWLANAQALVGCAASTQKNAFDVDPDATSASTGSGGSGGLGAAGGGGAGNDDPFGSIGGFSGTGGSTAVECGVLDVIIRDFRSDHIDFEAASESEMGLERGIVQDALGADGKPVYASSSRTLTTHGREYFDQWFRDTPTVNTNIPFSLTLTQGQGGVFSYDSSAFFPIDDQGFGNEAFSHNYHFTLEAHTTFRHAGGEVFAFRGDDDFFAYINGRLAIDLGGVHTPEQQTVELDAIAQQFGLVVGRAYPLDFFFVERHTVESNLRIETTIECLTPSPR
jgi:fibro-slime domain-containing protein